MPFVYAAEGPAYVHLVIPYSFVVVECSSSPELCALEQYHQHHIDHGWQESPFFSEGEGLLAGAFGPEGGCVPEYDQ